MEENAHVVTSERCQTQVDSTCRSSLPTKVDGTCSFVCLLKVKAVHHYKKHFLLFLPFGFSYQIITPS